MAGVNLDIRNAINKMPWQQIWVALVNTKVPEYLMDRRGDIRQKGKQTSYMWDLAGLGSLDQLFGTSHLMEFAAATSNQDKVLRQPLK